MRNGAMSPDTAAIAPPAAGPTSAPSAHAAFINPNAIPCGSPLRSAPFAMRTNAGVKRTPYAAPAATISGT